MVNKIKQIVICEIYRAPPLPTQPFIESIEAVLEVRMTKNLKLYLVGDFNFHLLKYLSGTSLSELIIAFLAQSFCPIASKLVGISKNIRSVSENVFRNKSAIFFNSRTTIITNTMSDHFSILVTIAPIKNNIGLTNKARI